VKQFGNLTAALLFGASLGAIAVAPTVSAQAQDFSAVEIETIPVAENIFMLVGQGGNIGVAVTEDGVFLVDDQFAPLTEKIRAAVKELSSEPIRYLVNTHWHFDHTGGNENLGSTGTTIVAHDRVRDRLGTDQFITAFQREIPASPDAALPEITYSDRTTLHLGDQTVRIIHMPNAHTDGDSVIHFVEANVLHAGDIFFNKRYPFIDYSSGGSIDGMILAVDRLLQMAEPDTQIIPGHGPLASRDDLVFYRELLVDVRTKALAAIAAGQPLEEFIASKPTAEFDAVWGVDFLSPEQFLTIVYQGIAASR